MNILIVDDNPDVRYSIEDALSSNNKTFQIYQACSGEECLEKLNYLKIDLVLMDIMMPGLDGVRTVQLIRKTPNFKNVKIAFLTAKSDDTTREIASLGGDLFLTKPIEPKNLLNSIDGLMKNK